MSRAATIKRETRETQIRLELEFDPQAPQDGAAIRSSLPFLDHMLHTLCAHGGLGLRLEARGDVEVDAHHLIEDVGISLGLALAQALTPAQGKAFSGIARAGYFAFPMDGTLALVAVDLCGRPNLVWNVELQGRMLGTLDPFLFREFFKGLVDGSGATLHVNVPYRDADHHVIEAVFKALGRALRGAVTPLPRPGEVMSTKGVLGEG